MYTHMYTQRYTNNKQTKWTKTFGLVQFLLSKKGDGGVFCLEYSSIHPSTHLSDDALMKD